MIDAHVRGGNISTSTWSDALDALGIAGVADGLRWRSGRSRLVGRAVTARLDIGAAGTYSRDAFAVGRMLSLAAAGEVLVVDMQGAQVSTFGGLAALAATIRGIAGAVIDGACRDLEDVQDIGFRLFSRHVTPRSGKTRASLVDTNGTVTCGQVQVEAGDIVVADRSGVVFVPAARFAEALDLAERLDASDRQFAERLKTGAGFADVAKTLGHF